MCASLLIKGKQTGTSVAVIRFERNVYEVISSRFPPSFIVTTGAAEAHGQMMLMSRASSRIRLLPRISNARISPTVIATNNIWNNPTHQCQRTGRNLWKSTLQKVTKSTRNMNTGKPVLHIGARRTAASSNAGT